MTSSSLQGQHTGTADLKVLLLGADYYFNVSIGPLPDGANVSEYLETGLKWPADPDAR
jgi:hypothetical protein